MWLTVTPETATPEQALAEFTGGSRSVRTSGASPAVATWSSTSTAARRTARR